MSQIKFQCSGCGKEHVGLPEIGCNSPDCYANATLEEQKRDFKLTKDTCVMNDADGVHYFVRGVLLVPIVSTKECFGWGIWVSLSERSYSRYLGLKDDREIAKEPPYFGWLSNDLPGYPSTRSLKTNVQLQLGNQRPLITLQQGDHPLSKEQREGISIERAIELVRPFLHP